MTSRDYCEETRQDIHDAHTHGTDYYKPQFEVKEDSGTIHMSLVDGEGNAVGITSTINTQLVILTYLT